MDHPTRSSEMAEHEGPIEADDRVALEEEADAAADFVEELLTYMGIDAIAEPTEHGEHLYVDVLDGSDEDMGLLIGRHGQTLDAIQELARMAVSKKLDRRARVIIDVQDYRKRREDRLTEDAQRAAEQVLADGGEVELAPMNAYERKVVHDAVSGISGVESFSRGEEPERFVVIAAT
jgi:spoIIIJ-associated protein